MSLTEEIREANTYADQHNAAWKAEARETAARINNDMQALMAAAEEILTAWHRDGLLRTDGRSRINACSYHAAIIRDVMMDARSDDAINAMEIV
jgi:hypothetical protein